MSTDLQRQIMDILIVLNNYAPLIGVLVFLLVSCIALIVLIKIRAQFRQSLLLEELSYLDNEFWGDRTTEIRNRLMSDDLCKDLEGSVLDFMRDDPGSANQTDRQNQSLLAQFDRFCGLLIRVTVLKGKFPQLNEAAKYNRWIALIMRREVLARYVSVHCPSLDKVRRHVMWRDVEARLKNITGTIARSLRLFDSTAWSRNRSDGR